MRKIIFMLVAVAACFGVSAQDATWSVYGGVSMSHPNGSTDSFFDKGWGAGGFIGASYDIAFNKSWSIMPSLELSYIHSPNSTTYAHGSTKYMGYSFSGGYNYGKFEDKMDLFNVAIPILVNYRVHFKDKLGMRFGIGPYLMQTLAGNTYIGEKQSVTKSYDFGKRFTVGGKVEIALETGKHWSYMIGCQYPFLKTHIINDTETFSAGVRYSF